MKYDLTLPVFDAAGKQQVDPDDKDKKITMREALERCLLSEFQDGGGLLSSAVKQQRYKIWKRLNGTVKSIELTVEEAKVVKDAAAAFPTLVHGQVLDFIESPSVN